MSIHAWPFANAHISQVEQPIQLGFLCPHNVRDKRSFSGTAYHAVRALEKRKDLALRLIGLHERPSRFGRWRKPRPAYDLRQKDLTGLDAAVGLVATPLLAQLAQLAPGLPFLHVTDATPKFLREAYGWAVPVRMDALEADVASQALVSVYSSESIAGRAAKDLAIADLTATCLPFGVNLESVPTAPCPKPSLETVELLFVGKDWERKGGDIAVEIVSTLRALNRPARLTIVGPCPENLSGRPGIQAVGSLDKTRPRHAKQLENLYARAHFLLVPSRADCTPMVIAEAMAHGTPVIAADTGGIRNQVHSPKTGRVMPLYSPPESWAEIIIGLSEDREDYLRLSEAAFEHCHNHFSWDAWALGIAALLQTALAKPIP